MDKIHMLNVLKIDWICALCECAELFKVCDVGSHICTLLDTFAQFLCLKTFKGGYQFVYIYFFGGMLPSKIVRSVNFAKKKKVL